MNMNKKKYIFALTAIAVLAAGGLMSGAGMGFVRAGGGGGGAAGGAAGGAQVRTLTLGRTNLVSGVSATGTIYSADTVNVYSDLNYAVKEVMVSVGDRVEAGQTLAILDTASLTSDIAQKRASLASNEATAQHNLETALRDLENYKNGVSNNYNTNLLNAETSLATAEMDLRSAQAEYNNARKQLNEAEDSENGIEVSDIQMLNYRNTATQRAIALEKAEANYEKALQTLEAAKNSSGNDLATYEAKVKSAELNTNFADQRISLQKLEKDIEKCTIKAPVSGTITAIQAIEGKSGSGQLFVIQDTENLTIVTNIQEYDIASVSVGSKVTIKTDATGDSIFTGVLSKIAPTSTQTATGTSATSTDAEYEAEVTVDAEAEGLRIGMNARLNIVLGEKQDVYAVPYEAVGTSPDGSSFIYVAEPDGKGGRVASPLPVETGMETDLYVEIMSASLTDGMIVLRSVQGVTPGMAVSAGGK